MQKAIITNSGWVLCAHCGHKLGKMVGGYISPTETPKSNTGENTKPKLQIKCTSCKTINEIEQ